MDNWTPSQIWAAVAAVASAVVLLSSALEKIVKAVKAAKAPGDKQDTRLDQLEDWQRIVNRKLDNDYKRLEAIEEGNHASQRALLALLDHGLNGNNVKQMQDAKEILQNHLINR